MCDGCKSEAHEAQFTGFCQRIKKRPRKETWKERNRRKRGFGKTSLKLQRCAQKRETVFDCWFTLPLNNILFYTV